MFRLPPPPHLTEVGAGCAAVAVAPGVAPLGLLALQTNSKEAAKLRLAAEYNQGAHVRGASRRQRRRQWNGGGGSSPGVQRGMPSSRVGAPLGTAAAQMVVAVRGGRRAGRDHQHAREGGCPSPSYYPHNGTAAALTLLTLKSVEMGCRGRGTGGASVAGQNTRGHGKGGHAQAATGYRRPPRRP